MPTGTAAIETRENATNETACAKGRSAAVSAARGLRAHGNRRGLELKVSKAADMHPREFADENALNDYAELHSLECLWEGTNGFCKRRRLAFLSPGQYHLATVQTEHGTRSALLFSRLIRRTDVETRSRVTARRKLAK
jgi:hypothetical protein